MPENLVLNLPYGNIFANLVIIVVGFAALYYWFDKDRAARRKDEIKAEDRLNKLLTDTTELLEKKITQQNDRIISLEKKVVALEAENKTLLDILQGRDKRSLEFYERTNETHDLVKKMVTITSETSRKIGDLVVALSSAQVVKNALTINNKI